MSLEPDVPVMYLLPEVAPLQDVTGIRVEIVGVSGSNETTLDVDILGCSKGNNHICNKPFSFPFLCCFIQLTTLCCQEILGFSKM